MTCSRPGAVTPEDLVAYVDGEADTRVGEHLRQCEHCAALARDYARIQHQLQSALSRVDCPTTLALGEYQLGLASPEARQRVAAHVLECPRCADELEVLRAFLAEPAPEPAASPGVVEGLRRVVAMLLTPQPGLAYAGLRGAAEATTKTYRAGDLTISLSASLEARRGSRSLGGLVLREGAAPESIAGAPVQLIGEATGTHSSRVDDLGSFAFPDLAPGSYRLELRLGDRLVVVEDIPVGSPIGE